VQFQHFKGRHLADQRHQPIVVRLELGLVDDADAEHLNFLAELIDVVVHHLEVAGDRKVTDHLLKAKLVE